MWDGSSPLDAAVPPMPTWERRLVVVSLMIHVIDVTLDVFVLILFCTEAYTGFAIGSGCVVLWAWCASSLYMSCSSGTPDGRDDGFDAPRIPRYRKFCAFLGNLSQVQIFTEAYRCLYDRQDGDFFHQLRLMEATLEAAPNALVQLYALAYLPSVGALPHYGVLLLRTSAATAIVSVGLSFSMFEQKIQGSTRPSPYVGCVAVMRMFEIASRSLTLALFATLTHPYGFWWALVLDYFILVCMTIRHKSVRSSYSFFLSIPLVLLSYEPVVWRREDHVVPKDRYYLLRIFEFAVMWSIIMAWQGKLSEEISTSELWTGMCIASWCSTIGLLMTLPCIYRVARRYEMSRDGGVDHFDPVAQGDQDFFSGSEGSDERGLESEDEDAKLLAAGGEEDPVSAEQE